MTAARVSEDPTAGLLRFRRYTWWSLIGGNLLVLLLPAQAWVTGGAPGGWMLALCWIAWPVMVLASIRLIQQLLPRRPDNSPTTVQGSLPVNWTTAGMVGAVITAIFLLAEGEYEFWAAPPAVLLSLVGAHASPRRRRELLGAALAASGVVTAIVTRATTGAAAGQETFSAIGVVGLVALINLSQLWTWQVAARLDDARRVDAELAVAEERLRFAAELHDVQGHHLQVLAFKTELAARLARSRPGDAPEHIEEIHRLLLEALHDTRAVAHGYRRTTIETEINNATDVLAAADIDARMHVEADTAAISDTSRHLLGMVMREATTNVLRHSNAREAEVHLSNHDSTVHLQVRNDGAIDANGTGGHGLTGLAERLTAAGGTLATHRDGPWFTLSTSVPNDSHEGDGR